MSAAKIGTSLGEEGRRKVAEARTTHGRSESLIYKSWSEMKRRCLNPADQAYPHYGARGITVCERWLTFDNFLADMGERPEGASLERVDNNGPYSPENCRWATSREQARNKRSSRFLEFGGEKLTLADWAERTGIGVSTLWVRLQRGWPVERALAVPVRPIRRELAL